MFKGSIVALVTPMQPTGALDLPGLERLVEWHVEQGTHGLLPCGTTGEASALSNDEYCSVIDCVVRAASNRVPVIAGVGAPATIKSIELTKIAEKAGVDGVLSVTPYYVRPGQDGLFAHYSALAKETSLPIILYNVPARTAVDLLPETVERLSKIDNIVGIKEATGDLKRAEQLRELISEKFVYLSGDDESACEFMLQGGHGVVSVTANIAPNQMASMSEAAVRGDLNEALAFNEPLSALHSALFCEPSPTPTKWLLSQMGKIDESVRLPLVSLSEESQDVLKGVSQKALNIELNG